MSEAIRCPKCEPRHVFDSTNNARPCFDHFQQLTRELDDLRAKTKALESELKEYKDAYTREHERAAALEKHFDQVDLARHETEEKLAEMADLASQYKDSGKADTMRLREALRLGDAVANEYFASPINSINKSLDAWYKFRAEGKG